MFHIKYVFLVLCKAYCTWRMIISFLSVPFPRQLMNVITCFPSSGGGKVVPAQLSEEGPARKGKTKRGIICLSRGLNKKAYRGFMKY